MLISEQRYGSKEWHPTRKHQCLQDSPNALLEDLRAGPGTQPAPLECYPRGVHERAPSSPKMRSLEGPQRTTGTPWMADKRKFSGLK
jgi:hypothetical protein